MKLPFGITISFNGNGNGKYVKKDECTNIHRLSQEHIDRKLIELTVDRNHKLTELKADLIEHINIKFDILRGQMNK